MSEPKKYTPSLHLRTMWMLEYHAPALARAYLAVRTPLRRRARARKLQRGYRHLAHVIIAQKRARQAT